MQWSDTIKEQLQALKPIQSNPEVIQRVVSLLDLTSLNADDNQASVASFIEKATTPYGHVAAVCIYPQFVRLCADEFANTPIKVATVINFPEGSSSLQDVLIGINRALEDGAQEIDVVFPYQRYLAGERQYGISFIESCKAACGAATLKVILETGILNDPAIIADAAYDAFAAGADFVKTSTGKVANGATLESAATLLLVARHVTSQVQRPLGVKVSGGIRDIAQAAQYIELADNILTRKNVMVETFRIGASKIIDEVLRS